MTKELHHPDWVRRLNYFGDAVGDPGRIVSIDPEELLGLARATTGLDDVGEAEWPGWEATYKSMVDAIEAESALHLLGRVLTRSELLRVLQTWLRLQDVWAATPRIAAVPVEAPLFVVGPPRTGTSILLELLALDEQLRAPYAYEALYPVPPLAGDHSPVELSEAEQELWADIDPEFQTMHELRSDLPCECVHFLMYDFAGPYWTMLYDTPSFMGWQLENVETFARVYRLHRRMLQTFEHSTGRGGRRWLLKSPAHLSTLPMVFAEYPDALVVHTHRDPARFIASLVSLLAVLRHMRSDRVDIGRMGPEMLAAYEMFLTNAIAWRQDGTVPNDRIVDSHFLDLMADPVAQLHRIYEQLGLDWPKGHDGVVRAYLDAKPKGKFGAHAYTFEDVALDARQVRDTFASYVSHYGIAQE